MRLIVTAIAAALLAACSSSGPIHEPVELLPLESALKVERLWQTATGASAEDRVYDHLTPVLDDGVIYTVGARGIVQANEAATGKALWQRDLELVVSAGLTVADGMVLLGTAKARVIALNSENGDELWRVKVPSEVLAPVAVSHNLVIVRSVDGVTVALSADAGAQIWRFDSSVPALSLRGDALPVVSDEQVFLGLANGRVAALSIYDGVVQWEATVMTPKGRTDLERIIDVDVTPLVVGDVLYVAAYQGRVVALSKLTGSMLWNRELSVSAGLAVDANNIYLADDAGQVWALDRKTGSTLWKHEQLMYRKLTAPVSYGDYVVVGDFEGYLHWLAKEDGRFVARHQVDSQGLGIAPLVENNVLYSRSKLGRLEALTLEQSESH